MFDKQKVFSTPLGDRKIDLYIPSKKVSIEVKSGYARSTAFTRKQVKKDRYLIDNEIERVVWFSFRGATKPLEKFLGSNGIEFCDLEYDTFNEQVSEAEKKIIRV